MKELAHRCEACGQTLRSVIDVNNLTPVSSETGPRILAIVEEDTRTPAGLVVVSNKPDAVYYARVVAIAAATRDVKVGDRIVFVRSVGVKIPIVGIGETRLLHEHEVLAIISEAA